MIVMQRSFKSASIVAVGAASLRWSLQVAFSTAEQEANLPNRLADLCGFSETWSLITSNEGNERGGSA